MKKVKWFAAGALNNTEPNEFVNNGLIYNAWLISMIWKISVNVLKAIYCLKRQIYLNVFYWLD